MINSVTNICSVIIFTIISTHTEESEAKMMPYVRAAAAGERGRATTRRRRRTRRRRWRRKKNKRRVSRFHTICVISNTCLSFQITLPYIRADPKL